MILSGLQKMTLIDYPGKIAAVVFTTGCNLRCSFCHNPEMVLPEKIVTHKDYQIQEKVFFNFLDRRIGILDGVSICGGEPTIHADLPHFCREIKSRGFSVKLDTNGRNPDMIEHLIEENLVDYFAMDIKHTWSEYESIVCAPVERDKYERSISLIQSRSRDYEFRSTVIKGVHGEESIHEMASYIAGAKRYFLQSYRSGITLDPDFSGDSFSGDELENLRKIALQYVKECEVRV
ncbi:anaerobic ribonucleoside-triphosphate reductase activating protein [Candidatus Gracilibacteria bacterium]|nr:anaerobic ribonucleoside-triphosphate reductase activating protein [Candidatus Gracilibacteria bacterium]